ncbi:MAG TPA: PAS domain S-box protein [Chitinophagaceae bacterium]|jgi:PAS domain S-box-containing protein|nr:PAS domain S-box protein [Chitinophagaceae bacterium]
MRIKKRILFIFGIALITTAGFFYFLYYNNQKIVNNSLQVLQAQKIIKNIDSAFYSIADVESGVKNLVIAGDVSFEPKVMNDIATLKRVSYELIKLKGVNASESLIINNLIQQIKQKIDLELELVRTNKISRQKALELLAEMKDQPVTDSLRQLLAGLRDIYSNQLNTELAENKAISKADLESSVIIGILAMILIGLILYQVNRYMSLRNLAEREAQNKEVKYSRFIEDSGLIVVLADLKGNINFVNKRVKNCTGIEPEEIIGKHFSTLVDKTWVPIINNNFRRQIQTKEFELQIEFPLNVKSGEPIWVEQSSTVMSEDGKPVGFQCILKDITEKKKAEEEAKKSEMEKEENQYRLQSILDNSTLIVYIKDLDGRYLLINKKYKELYQLTEEQAIGKTDFDLLSSDEAQRNFDMDQYVIREQKTIEIEETIEKSGNTYNLLMVRFPLYDKNHNIYGTVGIANDITERFLYGKHLIEEKSKAEMAEQLQEQFLANMSHEIRTPMNGIIGMTNILIDTPLSDEQKEFVHVIKKSSDNLLVLINDILDLSKIKAGKLRIENIDFQLRETVENTLAPFNVKIMEKGLKLGFVVDRNIPDMLIGDPHRLNQVLTNLLGNAVKFTEKGEINLGIKLLERHDDTVSLEFSVSDTGIGVSPDKLKYIFESFTQAETGITRKFGGTGLGLSITKKLIELQHGAIDVSSEQGKGTIFTFVLDYGISSKQEIGKPKRLSELRTLDNNRLSGKKILVVEDNETNQKVIFHMLKKFGVDIRIVNNGKEAIQVLEDGCPYDLLIMDLQMPEMDGFETTKYIRQQLKLKVPIFAMTASALRNEKTKCFELGMNEYLTKPFVPAELHQQLKKYLLPEDIQIHSIKDRDQDQKNISDKPYDLGHLIELEDADCLCEVLQSFLESTPLTLSEIESGIHEHDWDRVYKQSHKLKTSLGLLQMEKLLSVMGVIEINAKENKNLERIPGEFKKAELLFKQIKPMIEEELKDAVKLLVKKSN